MTQNLEGTTMEFIAEFLYDHFEAVNEWEDEDENIKQRYRKLAVQIIDKAEPVWRRRTDHLYYEYVVVSAKVPTERWQHITATHIPYTSREAAYARKREVEEDYGETPLVLRRLKGGDWEEAPNGA